MLPVLRWQVQDVPRWKSFGSAAQRLRSNPCTAKGIINIMSGFRGRKIDSLQILGYLLIAGCSYKGKAQEFIWFGALQVLLCHRSGIWNTPLRPSANDNTVISHSSFWRTVLCLFTFFCLSFWGMSLCICNLSELTAWLPALDGHPTGTTFCKWDTSNGLHFHSRQLFLDKCKVLWHCISNMVLPTLSRAWEHSALS